MVSVIVAIFKRYKDFCIANDAVEKNYFKDYFNYFSTISGVKDFEKYIDVTARFNKYITRESLDEMQKQLVNEQDIALVELVFIGVLGKQGEELINLKVKDIIPEKIIRNDKNEIIKIEPAKIILPKRKLEINTRTFEILSEADGQKEYYKNNGEIIETTRSKQMIINTTDYVLRLAGSTKFDKITYNSIQARINRIKDFFGNPYLSLTSIWHSGMLETLKNIKNEKGIIEKEDYVKVNAMYGYNKILWYQSKVRFEPFL